MRFVGDGWIIVTVALAIIAGGLGFPVWFELSRRVHDPRRWTLHTKLTLRTAAVLLCFGFVAVAVFEWGTRRRWATWTSRESCSQHSFRA